MWLLTPISQLGVIAAIVRCKLTRSFPVFIAFLLFDVLRSVSLWWLGHSPFSRIYREIWISTEPVYLLLELLVVLELYRLLYRAYPGIQRFAGGLVLIGLIAATVITFGTVKFDLSRIGWTLPTLQGLFLTKRVVCSVLGILVFITMALFPRAPSAKNVLLHGWLLAALLNIAAVGFFAINVGTNTEWIGTVFLVLQMGCFLWWAVALEQPGPPKPPPTIEETRRVEELNDELVAFMRWLAR